MGWTIILEGEDGRQITELPFEINYAFVETIKVEKYKLLKYIDYFGDTTFNHLQMNDLIEDLNILKNEITFLKKEIDALIELSMKCQSGTHLYLKFYGD